MKQKDIKYKLDNPESDLIVCNDITDFSNLDYFVKTLNRSISGYDFSFEVLDFGDELVKVVNYIILGYGSIVISYTKSDIEIIKTSKKYIIFAKESGSTLKDYKNLYEQWLKL